MDLKPSDKAEIEQLIKQLNSWRPAKRKEAAEQLLVKGAVATAPIAQALQREKRITRKMTVACQAVTIALIVLFFTSLLINPVNPALMAVMMAWFIIGNFLVFSGRTRSSRTLLKLLKNTRNAQAAPLLAEMLEISPIKTFYIPWLTLSQLLPQMDAEQFAQMSFQQRKLIYDAFLYHKGEPKDTPSEYYPAPHLLGIIDELKDTAALPKLKYLAKDKSFPRFSQPIQETIKALIPTLEAKLELEKSNKTLLRPADAEAEFAELLLRSSAIQDDAPPDQLLRSEAPTEEGKP